MQPPLWEYAETCVQPSFYPDGIPKQLYYRGCNGPHREDGPAYVRYYPSGLVEYCKFMQNGKKHNVHGPAIIKYAPNGKVISSQWFIDGKEILPKWFKDLKMDIGKHFTQDNIAMVLMHFGE